MVPPTPKRIMWRVTEAPWRMLQRSLCCSALGSPSSLPSSPLFSWPLGGSAAAVALHKQWRSSSRTWPRPHFSPCGSSQPSPLCLPTLADHPCGSALLTAWPRGGHSPGLDPGFVYGSSFAHAFSSSPSSRAHVSPAALNCSRLFSGPSLRVSFNLASWGGLNVPALGSHVWATPLDI